MPAPRNDGRRIQGVLDGAGKGIAITAKKDRLIVNGIVML
ncbi:hypothetical protein BACEGG_00097 [Bacteroides eggerthii DSM 20697]|jgi:hypothetical protein|nr:hypothetical protein BACEGG_00097 [Bacteroides eggerthii DSM 20697]